MSAFHRKKNLPQKIGHIKTESLSSVSPIYCSETDRYSSQAESDIAINTESLSQSRRQPRPACGYKSATRMISNFTSQSTYDEKINPGPDESCSNCIQHMQKIQELKIQQNLISEKFVATEKHLKQYDSLLQVKDKRLAQRETELKAELYTQSKEKKRIEKEKAWISIEKEKINTEKEYLTREHEKLDEKARNINIQMMELDQSIQDFELARKSIETEDSQLRSYEEFSVSLLLNREDDIKRLINELHAFKEKNSNPSSGSQSPMKTYKPETAAKRENSIKDKRAEFFQLAEDLILLKEKLEDDIKKKH